MLRKIDLNKSFILLLTIVLLIVFTSQVYASSSLLTQNNNTLVHDMIDALKVGFKELRVTAKQLFRYIKNNNLVQRTVDFIRYLFNAIVNYFN